MFWLIIILVALLIFYFKFYRKRKIPKVGSFALVTGGVKTGKSTMSVALVKREYNSRLKKVKFYNFLHKKNPLETPLVYSNVPLAFPYVPLTADLLLRNERFAYGSVIYIQEASLVADSQLIKDKNINENLLLFNKLIGHSTKGGCIIYDTQCIADVHYSIKRCLSTYFYIHSCHKCLILPFIICEVRELMFSDDNTSIVNSFDKDVEEDLKKVWIPKKTWKYFDCYCFSKMTDDKPVNTNVVEPTTLKTDDVISFRKWSDKK